MPASQPDPLACAQGEAVPWILLGAAWTVGAAVAAWAAAHRPETLAWLRSIG